MLKEYPFFWVDAFTDKTLSGNPCAVVLNADSLSDEQMLKITQEMNLSETAFVLKSNRADFRARYFTPQKEIPLAGHPTIATVRVLLEEGKISLHNQTAKITLELPAGIVHVDLSVDEAGRTLIKMTQLEPQFLKTYPAEKILPCFGLDKNDLCDNSPIQSVSTGTPMLMLHLKNIQSVKKVKTNLEKMKLLMQEADFFSVHLFCLEGATSEAQTFARHPGLEEGALEDPFTGSATGCMGAYLWKYGFVKEDRFKAEQGHFMGRPGSAIVERIGDVENIKAVRVGGTAVTLIKGVLKI